MALKSSNGHLTSSGKSLVEHSGRLKLITVGWYPSHQLQALSFHQLLQTGSEESASHATHRKNGAASQLKVCVCEDSTNILVVLFHLWSLPSHNVTSVFSVSSFLCYPLISMSDFKELKGFSTPIDSFNQYLDFLSLLRLWKYPAFSLPSGCVSATAWFKPAQTIFDKFAQAQ